MDRFIQLFTRKIHVYGKYSVNRGFEPLDGRK